MSARQRGRRNRALKLQKLYLVMCAYDNRRTEMRLANRVDIGNLGFRFYHESNSCRIGKESSKRGVISGFSKSSVRRLRDLLVFGELASTERSRFGYTITVPWSDLSGEVLEDYRASFNRFGVSFTRALPNSCLVYRHELQRRRAPHWHGILFLSVYDDFDPSLIGDLWRRAIRPVKRGGNKAAFLKFGVKGISIDGGFASFRYLCDHQSKHKQAQLGYLGKQWGVLNRKCLVKTSDTFNFQDRQQLIGFFRLLRRYGRFTVKSRQRRLRGSTGAFDGLCLPLDCPFGTKKCRARKSASAVFAPPDFLDQYLQYLSLPVSVYPLKHLPT